MKKLTTLHKRAGFISAFFLILALFLFLYYQNIIFVKTIEHGVVANKLDLGGKFGYEIFIEGKSYSFSTQDKSIDLDAGVINFKIRKSTIVKFLGYVKPVSEKIMKKSSSSMELEYEGYVDFSKNPSVYKTSGKFISNNSLSSVLVGSRNIKVYRDNNNKIKTIIINGDTDLSLIRVGIKNSGFESLSHNKLELLSDGIMNIEDKKDNKSLSIPSNTKISFTPIKEGIAIETNNINEVIKNRLYISSQASSIIKILNLKRSYENPIYRGSFEITNTENSLRLINELNMENYLYKVVPSEMPSSFGFEALKAQSVAARTYAISDLLSNRYADEGFHVDDSTMSQVYNNIGENLLTTKAVESTKGLVMKYGNDLVDAKYYSTSHGYGANTDEIWSSDGVFPGTKKPYLVARSYLLNGEVFNLSSEETASKFFKDWNLKSYDINSPYFRWRTFMTGDELKNSIEKNLPLVYEDQKNYILTLKDGKFKSTDIPAYCLGQLKDIKVVRRGEGGNIMELLIEGTNGTYKVVKELNVRYVLRPRKSDTGFDRDIIIKRIKGDDLKNTSLLPSAFMALDVVKDNRENVSQVTFYGGGYGHSVGMSQYGAGYLASKGFSFDKILKIYYKDIEIEKIY